MLGVVTVNAVAIDMGLTEAGVKLYMLELVAEGKNPTPLLVSERARCHYQTVVRVYRVMIARGELTREGTSRLGYTYRLTNARRNS